MAKPTSALKRARPLSRSGLLGGLLGGLLLCLLLSACGGRNNNVNTTDIGGFRVINALSDSPDVTFFLEGSNLGARSFGQASSFTTVRDGRYDISARFTTLDNQTSTLLDDERVRVRTAEQTTLILAGTMAAPVALVVEEEAPSVDNDATELRLLNTAGAGSFDVYLSAPDAALGTALTTAEANAFSTLLTAPAGTRQIRLTQAGSDAVIFDSGAFELPGGQRILLHIRPYFGPGDATVDVGVIDSTRTSTFPLVSQPVSVRIANAIADMPAVDVAFTSSGTTSSLTDLPVNSFSDPQILTPGPAEIDVTMQTDPGTVFVANAPELVGGERRTLITAGSFGDNTTTGRLAIDPQRPISTVAQINLMHASVAAGRVDVYLLRDGDTTADTAIAVQDLALLANTNLNVLAGTYSLVFTRRGENEELAGPIPITVSNNQLYSILLTDAVGGGQPPLIIRGPNFE